MKRVITFLSILLAAVTLIAIFVQRPSAPAPAPSPSPSASAVSAAPSAPAVSVSPSASPDTSPGASASGVPSDGPAASPADNRLANITENTECDDKDCVAYYVYTYKHLPANYMTKRRARKAGWRSGALSRVVEGKAIGGGKYMNLSESLPTKYNYIECDIDTIGQKTRGTKRIVFSEGCEVVYYTEDHYETFELLYGEED